MRLLKIGRKYLKPHRCPGCHKFMWLVRYPAAIHCPACQKRSRRQRGLGRRDKYNKRYKRRARYEREAHPWCALCGCSECLTCHHTVNVESGEWQGRHLTVLCVHCHDLWETKVNLLRNNLK